MVHVFAPTGQFVDGVEQHTAVAYKVWLNVLDASTLIEEVTINPDTEDANSTKTQKTDGTDSYYEVYVPYTDDIPNPGFDITLIDHNGQLKVIDKTDYIAADPATGIVHIDPMYLDLNQCKLKDDGSVDYYWLNVRVLSSMGVRQVEQLNVRRNTAGSVEQGWTIEQYQQALEELYSKYSAQYTIRVRPASMDFSLVEVDYAKNGGAVEEVHVNKDGVYLVFEEATHSVADLFVAMATSESNIPLSVSLFDAKGTLVHTQNDKTLRMYRESNPLYTYMNTQDETHYTIRVQSREFGTDGPYKDYPFVIKKVSSDRSVRVVVTYLDDEGQTVRREVILPTEDNKDSVNVPIGENTTLVQSIEVFPINEYTTVGVDETRPTVAEIRGSYWSGKVYGVPAVLTDVAVPLTRTELEDGNPIEVPVKTLPVYVQAKAQDGSVQETASGDAGYTVQLVRQNGNVNLKYVRNENKRTLEPDFWNATIEKDGTYTLYLNAVDADAALRIAPEGENAILWVEQLSDEDGKPVPANGSWTSTGNPEYADDHATRGTYLVRVVAENGKSADYTVRIVTKSSDFTIGFTVDGDLSDTKKSPNEYRVSADAFQDKANIDQGYVIGKAPSATPAYGAMGPAAFTTLLLQPTDDHAKITRVKLDGQEVDLYEPTCTYDASNMEPELTLLDKTTYTGGPVMVKVAYGTDEPVYEIWVEAQDGSKTAENAPIRIKLVRQNASVKILDFKVNDDLTGPGNIQTLTPKGDGTVYTALIDTTTIQVNIITDTNQHTDARVYEFSGTATGATGNTFVQNYTLPTSVVADTGHSVPVRVRDVSFYNDPAETGSDPYVTTPYAQWDYTLDLYRTSPNVAIGKIIAIYHERQSASSPEVIREATPMADNPTVYEVSIPKDAYLVDIQATAESAYTHLYHFAQAGNDRDATVDELWQLRYGVKRLMVASQDERSEERRVGKEC